MLLHRCENVPACLFGEGGGGEQGCSAFVVV